MSEVLSPGEGITSQETVRDNLRSVLERAGRESWAILAGTFQSPLSEQEREFLRPISPVEDIRVILFRGVRSEEEELVSTLNLQTREILRRGLVESGSVPVDKFLEKERAGELDPDKLIGKLGIRRTPVPTTFEGASVHCGLELFEVATYFHEKYGLGPGEAIHVTEDPECAMEMTGLISDLHDYRGALALESREGNDPERVVELAILELELAYRMQQRAEKIGTMIETKVEEAKRGVLPTKLGTERTKEKERFQDILGNNGMVDPWGRIHSGLEERLSSPRV